MLEKIAGYMLAWGTAIYMLIGAFAVCMVAKLNRAIKDLHNNIKGED